MRFKTSNISYDTKYKNLGLFKKEILINNFINLKKNNNDDHDDDSDRKITRFIINVVYNIILYSYISYYIANHHL
jgi:hypothetical protein